MEKIEALAEFLEIDLDEIEESSYDSDLFEVPGAEWLVLDDDEADQRAADYIRSSVWAFNASFLQHYMADGKLSAEDIERLRGDSCEDINDAFLAMIDDEQEFIDDAIRADGRGHFMNTYDGEEREHGEYFLYRTN